MQRKVFLAAIGLAMLIHGQSLAGMIGDAEIGKKKFRKCLKCHEIGPDAKVNPPSSNPAIVFGPPLTGVLRRPVASFEGYSYSPSLEQLGQVGGEWNPKRLGRFLENPSRFLAAVLDNRRANSTMRYKVRREQERLDIIAYLLELDKMDEKRQELEAEASEETTRTLKNASQQTGS